MREEEREQGSLQAGREGLPLLCAGDRETPDSECPSPGLSVQELPFPSCAPPFCREEAWYLRSDGDGALPTPMAFGHIANIVRMLKNQRTQKLYFLLCFLLL